MGDIRNDDTHHRELGQIPESTSLGENKNKLKNKNNNLEKIYLIITKEHRR